MGSITQELSHPRTRKQEPSTGAERGANLGDDVHDAGAVGGAERVDEVADEEGEERHRHAVGHGRHGSHHHQRRVPPVREREQPVHRHRLRAAATSSSSSPAAGIAVSPSRHLPRLIRARHLALLTPRGSGCSCGARD